MVHMHAYTWSGEPRRQALIGQMEQGVTARTAGRVLGNKPWLVMGSKTGRTWKHRLVGQLNDVEHASPNGYA